VRPRPLSDDAVAELVASELGDQADAVFSDACHEATGGNPFLVRELLRELTAEGVSPGSDEVPLVRQLAPPTVARAVLLRLARLGDDASALAHAVAVLGDGAPMRRACALAGLAEDRGGELASSLAQAGILAPARPLAFAHPILRSAVYADMDAGQRAQSHGRAADLLSSEGAGADAVAVQLLASEPAANPHVAASLREGAAHALARGAPRTAVACLERALAEPPPADQRGPVLLELASAEFVGGEPSAAAHHFEEAFSIASDPRSRAEYARDRGLALQAIGRHEEAFAVRERAVDEVEHVDPALARLLEVSLVASARFDLRRLAWAIERLERRPAGPVSDTPAEHGLLAMQAHVAAFSPESDRSAEALADSLEAAVASDKLLTAGLATPFFSAVDLLILADRTDLARRALDRSVEEARRGGSALRFAFSSGVRSLLLARSGALAEAEADARACAELALPQGWFVLGPVILGLVLDTLIERGELQEAGRLLARSGMGDRPADHDLTFDPVVHARARLRAAQGDVAGGRADLGSLARRRARWNTYPSLVPAVLAAPELADGDPDEVRASAQRMVSEAERWGTSRAIGMALRAAGLLETEAQGLELLEQAVTVLESSPAPLEYARALADFGAALRRANRRADARDPLRRALDLADACGAKPLGDRARQELRAAGGRPRRPRTSGAESLTASERRIATMAAEGLSNPEIAQALFVTRKTVEAHLGNAYRKLDISSRAQLGQALRTGSGDLP
jgi:DNA-binding CsgD family transcriptional regulator